MFLLPTTLCITMHHSTDLLLHGSWWRLCQGRRRLGSRRGLLNQQQLIANETYQNQNLQYSNLNRTHLDTPLISCFASANILVDFSSCCSAFFGGSWRFARSSINKTKESRALHHSIIQYITVYITFHQFPSHSIPHSAQPSFAASECLEVQGGSEDVAFFFGGSWRFVRPSITRRQYTSLYRSI